MKATRSGDEIVASAEPSGGTGPYTLRWSSSSTALDDTGGSEIAYERHPRGKDSARSSRSR